MANKFAASIAPLPEVQEWVDQHDNPNAWKRLLTPGQEVIALHTLGFISGSKYRPTGRTWRLCASGIKPDEIGRVVKPHEDDKHWWLIEFGADDRCWWVYWYPSQDETAMCIRPIETTPDNDPTRYDGRLL